MSGFQLKSARFRSEREASWRALEELVIRVERGGVEALSPEELTRLPLLYRSAVSALSVARAISLDQALLTYLNALVSRSYFVVYRTKRSAGEVAGAFCRARLPQEVRAQRGQVGLAIALLMVGVLVGFAATLADSARYSLFVSPQMAQGRTPGSTVEELRAPLYGTGDEGGLTFFASYLFSHNAGIGILCFALGFVAGIPTVLLLLYNGLVLGAMWAVYHDKGLSLEFLAWILPHGVTELLAVVLAAAGGLVLGRTLLFPEQTGRVSALAREGRRAAVLAMGAVGLFFLAALIEGFFRQLVHDSSVRWLVAAATFIGWLVYFWRAGRREQLDRDW